MEGAVTGFGFGVVRWLVDGRFAETPSGFALFHLQHDFAIKKKKKIEKVLIKLLKFLFYILNNC